MKDCTDYKNFVEFIILECEKIEETDITINVLKFDNEFYIINDFKRNIKELFDNMFTYVKDKNSLLIDKSKVVNLKEIENYDFINDKRSICEFTDGCDECEHFFTNLKEIEKRKLKVCEIFKEFETEKDCYCTNFDKFYNNVVFEGTNNYFTICTVKNKDNLCNLFEFKVKVYTCDTLK